MARKRTGTPAAESADESNILSIGPKVAESTDAPAAESEYAPMVAQDVAVDVVNGQAHRTWRAILNWLEDEYPDLFGEDTCGECKEKLAVGLRTTAMAVGHGAMWDILEAVEPAKPQYPE
jgi:hypothetical protein